MNVDEPTAAQTSAEEPSPPSPSRRNRFSRLLIVAGALISLAPLARIWPREHQIDFRIEDGVADVTRFDVEWSRLDGDVAGDVISSSSRSFERGHAPEIVNVAVHLPNGSYALDIRIEHADRTDAIQRRVMLGDTNRISVPLRADQVRP
jgi:hypothetical protein